MSMRFACFVVLCLIGRLSVTFAAEIEFGRDIRPILSDNCFMCHGPDAETREAGLRLDVEESAIGSAIVRGKPAESELIARVSHPDPDLHMPPLESNKKLSADEIELLNQWIQQGAKWGQHWAFVPPQRAELPVVPFQQWCRNPIDHFAAEMMSQQGLSPSKPAELRALLRRVTLDLTGIPPTLDEVQAFLADRAPGAYERVVDRLLRSPRFGETMALDWLDAARFADTDGYQNDGPRSMWRWRDWVIDAFNRGMPFDQFTIEQLAGDLLPNPTLEQHIATGFNRNHRYNSEAGLVLEEFLLENAVDRVDTTATVWMGLTMGCARCHDHKFDPVSQKEYYRLIAFFDKVAESGRAVKFGNSEPWIKAPTWEQQEKLVSMEEKASLSERALLEAAPQINKALTKWAAGREHAVARACDFAEDDAQALDLPAAIHGGKKEGASLVEGPAGVAIEFDGDSDVSFKATSSLRCESRFSISFWLNSRESNGVVFSQQQKNQRRTGVAVQLVDEKLRFFVITRWIAGVACVETAAKVPLDRWVHVTVTNDGSQSATGMSIWLDGERVENTILYNTNSNTGGADAKVPIRLGSGVNGDSLKGAVGDLRIFKRMLWDDEIRRLSVPDSVSELAGRLSSAASMSPKQKEALTAWFLENEAPEKLGSLLTQFRRARSALFSFESSLPTSMVMQEAEQPRETFVRLRGAYDKLGEKVSPGVPGIMPSLADAAPKNRLGLASWLVSGEHPLTARVTVNRFWQHYFGVGLVKTSADFGLQGELPSHPALLDWLATEFVQSGWDIKGLQKLIVMSATYRQASAMNAAQIHADPTNRYLARGPRFRLAAHVIRDSALSIGGLLTQRIGGPSVSPVQPAGLWAELSNMRYKTSKGEDLYRRSLYTIWKRTLAPPSMAVLDAADRESCSVRVRRTNTPLQALTLLNEDSFVESARGLASRMLTEGTQDPIGYGFELVTSRAPTTVEREVLQKALAEYQVSFDEDPRSAKQLIAGSMKRPVDVSAGRHAAFVTVANILLNLDEAITKE